MNKSTLGLIIILAVIAALLGFNYFKHPFANFNQAAITATPVPDATAVAPVASSSATPEQKIATLLAYPVSVPALASGSATPADTFVQDLAWIAEHQPAMVTLYGSRISTTSAQTTIAQIKAEYPPDQPPLIAIDHEGGNTQPLSGAGFVIVPSWQALCSQSATASAQILTKSLSQVAQVGVNVVLGPVVDVSAAQPVLGTRVCSGNSQTVVVRGAQFAQIALQEHLLPVFKHFPGIGASHLDLHKTFDRVTVTPTDATVYQQLLGQFPTAGVMVAPIGVTNQYPDKPCSLSPDCVAQLTTNYPQALIMSDALDMKATSFVPAANQATGSASVATPLTLPQVSEAAVRAGDQILLYGQTVTSTQMDEVFRDLVATYNQDQAFAAQVDKAVTEVQTARAGLVAGASNSSE